MVILCWTYELVTTWIGRYSNTMHSDGSTTSSTEYGVQQESNFKPSFCSKRVLTKPGYWYYESIVCSQPR